MLPIGFSFPGAYDLISKAVRSKAEKGGFETHPYNNVSNVRIGM
jgi:hypothetical protein